MGSVKRGFKDADEWFQWVDSSSSYRVVHLNYLSTTKTTPLGTVGSHIWEDEPLRRPRLTGEWMIGKYVQGGFASIQVYYLMFIFIYLFLPK